MDVCLRLEITAAEGPTITFRQGLFPPSHALRSVLVFFSEKFCAYAGEHSSIDPTSPHCLHERRACLCCVRVIKASLQKRVSYGTSYCAATFDLDVSCSEKLRAERTDLKFCSAGTYYTVQLPPRPGWSCHLGFYGLKAPRPVF